MRPARPLPATDQPLTSHMCFILLAAGGVFWLRHSCWTAAVALFTIVRCMGWLVWVLWWRGLGFR